MSKRVLDLYSQADRPSLDPDEFHVLFQTVGAMKGEDGAKFTFESQIPDGLSELDVLTFTFACQKACIDLYNTILSRVVKAYVETKGDVDEEEAREELEAFISKRFQPVSEEEFHDDEKSE